MTRVIVALLAALAALTQIGAVPAAFFNPLAGPVLPVALIAGWAAVRDPREVWPAALVAAIILGAVSEARIGWYLVALLPAGALVMLLRGTEGRRTVSVTRRLAYASLTGAAGAVAYVALLSLTGGTLRALPFEASAIAWGAVWTGVLATTLGATLWPLRAQNAGLFA